MDIRFWGTRGSLAKPGRITLRHGGNTSCVEVRGDDGTLIVLDCGTGAHGLGQALLSAGPRCDGHLMITHTHWDHIQGFPFFAPLFVPGNTWDIYAPGALGRQLEQTLAGQMEYNYFPVTLAQLAATIRFHDIAEGEFAIGEMRVTTNISITRLSRWAIACSPAAMRLCTRWITSRMPRTRRQEPRVSHRGTRRTSVTSISLRTRISSFTTLSTRLRSIRRRRAGATRPPSGRSTTR